MDYSEISFKKLMNDISSTKEDPSGGSVIALMGSEACALTLMIVNYSINNKAFELYKEENLEVKNKLENLNSKFMSLIDEDIQNFEDLKNSYSLPTNTADERNKKVQLIEEGSKKANIVPLTIIEDSFDLIQILDRLRITSSASLKCDVGVCASLVKSTINSCYLTVLSNLTNIKDENYVQQCLQELTEVDTNDTKLNSIIDDIKDKEKSKLEIEISRDDS